MRETLEAIRSLGLSVGQPEMAPQSEPKSDSHHAQDPASLPRGETVLGSEVPGSEEGTPSEQAGAPCKDDQVHLPQKTEPADSCPGEEWMIRKVKVEEEDPQAEEDMEWPQHLPALPSGPFPAPDLGSPAATYKLEPGSPGPLDEWGPPLPSPPEKPFGCGDCERRFRDQLTLRLHQRLHRGEGPGACPDCGRSFAQRAHLLLHLRAHTAERPFPCAECGRRFRKKAHLTRHLRTHTGERPFPCAHCGKRFSQKIHLGAHLNTHTGERPFPCAECGRRFRKKTHLVRHQRIHTGERPFQCVLCARSFTHKQHLLRHQRVHEAGLRAPATPGSPAASAPQPFTCAHCGSCFGWKVSPDSALGECGLDPALGCGECALGAALEPTEAPPDSGCGPGSAPTASQGAPATGRASTCCPRCGRSSALGQQVTRPRRVPPDERPFPCAQCGHRLLLLGPRPGLGAHPGGPGGARPFVCAQCGRRFSRKSHLGRHQAVHTGSRPHTCAVCARSFSSKTNLARHQATHTGSRPFACAHCTKSFSRKTHLLRHQRVHGPDLLGPSWAATTEVTTTTSLFF
ncbi:zinc finger protein 467 isoform X2 [Erinaceus europaeus]|uniref:Zinc finger protein 467 isoform X2 n=1 Tax=Erinaceus europaeus TaxID=9365 RepID=A0ABM3XVA6_ERIEU|nr:zinc finger protein 467 isoform X2 [Erinaceus europaeus]